MINTLVEKVWRKSQDIAGHIYKDFYLRYNSPIPNLYLDALFRVGLHEATFYAFYSKEEGEPSNRKHLPPTVFRQVESRFTDYKSGVYDAILHSLGTTNPEVAGSLIVFYLSEVLISAEDTVAAYRGHKQLKLRTDLVRSQVVKSVLELLPGMESIEASVQKS